MSSPLFSVVIPAYNASKTIHQTVKSVLAQTVQDFEVIIVDDGSPKDNTLEIAQSLAKADSRFKAVSKKNGGASSARNTGIQAATGKYIALLDADDLWIPEKLERQLSVLESEKNISAVQSGAFFVNDALEVISVRPCFESKDALLETLLFQNLPNAMSTTVVERRVFEKIGYFDTSLVILEDWEFMIRLARFCNLKSIVEPLSLYRVHPGNRSRDLSIHIEPGYIVLDRLFKDSTLPSHIKSQESLIYSTFYRMLSGGAFNIGKYGEAVQWGVKALSSNPVSLFYMASLPFRRLQRKQSKSLANKEYIIDENWLTSLKNA